MVSLLFFHGSGYWKIILYNPENWFPFALYLVIGTVMGYASDKNRCASADASGRIQNLERENGDMSVLLTEAVENNEQYKNQILGHRDSFGKIFNVVRKLNGEVQENILSEAVNILEGLLDNRSIAVYSMSANGAYARLVVSSKALTGTVTKSIKMSEFAPLNFNTPPPPPPNTPSRVWVNRDLLPDCPAFCAPIYSGNVLIALVLVMEADSDQMSLYHHNLFTILCGLIQDALVRAIKYNNENKDKRYIAGTGILKPDVFQQIYDANLKMAEQGKLRLKIVLVEPDGESFDDFAVKLENCVRDTDVIGKIRKDLFAIILTQIDNDNLQNVLGRLEKAGLKKSLSHDLEKTELPAA
jgi:UDP-glucose 4-epimerase